MKFRLANQPPCCPGGCGLGMEVSEGPGPGLRTGTQSPLGQAGPEEPLEVGAWGPEAREEGRGGRPRGRSRGALGGSSTPLVLLRSFLTPAGSHRWRCRSWVASGISKTSCLIQIRMETVERAKGLESTGPIPDPNPFSTTRGSSFTGITPPRASVSSSTEWAYSDAHFRRWL